VNSKKVGMLIQFKKQSFIYSQRMLIWGITQGIKSLSVIIVFKVSPAW